LKPSLVYAILIIVVVVAATLFARSNIPVPDNSATSIESPNNDSKAQEGQISKQEAGSDTKAENGGDKAGESAGKNAGEKE